MEKVKYEPEGKPVAKNALNRTAELTLDQIQEEKNRVSRSEQTLENDLEVNPEKVREFDLQKKLDLKNEQDQEYRPEKGLKPEPESEKAGITNDNDPKMTEEECLSQLESLLTHDLMAKFVAAHYSHDDGNDSPATPDELEESFRNFVTLLGFRGPKIEAFVKRAMTVIDDFDVSDKYDNIDQATGIKLYLGDADIDYTSSLAGLEVEVDMQDDEGPDLGTKASKKKNPNLNNPYYINPNKKPSPFDR